jgi:anaerobic selenocysteine-containing dehydrogenase
MLTALAKLKWLIVVENFETETAAFWNAKRWRRRTIRWRASRRTSKPRSSCCPRPASPKRTEHFVNSSRWLQWKEAALDPPGQALRDQEIIARLFLKIRDLYREEGGKASEPLMAMRWDYATPHCPSLVEVARELNGAVSSRASS